MQLYQYKPLDVGFVILCPDRNPGTLRITANGLRSRYRGCAIVAAVADDVNDEELEAMNKVCPTHKGQETITSLINTGLNNSASCWSIVVIAGCHVRQGLDIKYSYFVNKTTDILFPIVDGKTTFVDGTINGIMIHKDTWKMIGNFCNQNPLGICKMLWAIDAIEKGCTFKAIMNARII